MADDSNESNSPAQRQPPSTQRVPDPALKRLDRLVGTWQVSGQEIDGQVTFEWLEGGFFFAQHFDLDHNGHKIKGIELIGYGRNWDGTSSQDCTSHMFDNEGNAFTYTWDVSEDTLTIWGGERGSPDHYKGKFGDDGNRVTGAWEWPGGGYEATMTRIKGKSE